jgi:hypothetical protein
VPKGLRVNRIIRLFGVGIFLAGSAVAQPQIPPAPVNKPVEVPAGASLPDLPRLTPFTADPGLPSLRSADLEILHSRSPLAGFVVKIAGQSFGIGSPPATIGYVYRDALHWLDMTKAPLQKQSVAVERNQIQSTYQCADTDGATWHVTQHFRPQRVAGAIEVQTDISVDQDRAVAFLPMLMVFPGAGSFGTAKGQGLFAGLEYLADEASSSEADVIGPASHRQVPDELKITFPLMAVQSHDRYLALTWQMRPRFSALFDSPDRLFGSGAHAMGLLFPGSNGKNRVEGSLLPRQAEVLHANEVLTLRATILAGAGTTIVPAVQHYLKLRPLPTPPAALSWSDYVARASGGWLDSKIRQGDLIRHAVAGGGFPPQPAADAALWMRWLAVHDSNPDHQAQLNEAVTNILSAVTPPQYDSAGVGHVRYPVESLVFGHVEANAEQARRRANELLARFSQDGSVKYQPKPGGPDFARTHSTNEASGFASRVVLDLLEAAAFCGDRDLIDKSLRQLRVLDKFHDGVPRGAQTWECPLHTPDILASAQMARAYTMGFELSGDPHFLDEARYWGWTGVPFVYLVNPTEAPVGLFATIAVYGATQWKAPVWFGLPVQWCGLVYADALYRLTRYDPKGPWKQIADGITLSGMQQSWTQDTSDFQGLLPDSFALREQKRNGPAINPATLEACAARYFDPHPVYDFHCFRTNGLYLHVPGEIRNPAESKGHVSFQVESWVTGPYYVLLSGFPHEPHLKINGRSVACADPHQFTASLGHLILQLRAQDTVELAF